jgi:uncharacterized protein YndB with AHSA1/START domain
MADLSLARQTQDVTNVQTMSTSTHTASRIILAPPRAVFRAFVDPEVLVNWRAPAGMTARIEGFDPRRGGGYRMTLTYTDSKDGPGKSDATTDVVNVRFAELDPDERIVEEVLFETADPAFGGTMTLTTTMIGVTGGTKVTLTAENVPAGISADDHRQGMESALKNLANLLD